MDTMGKLLKKLKLSCEDTSPLISESMDHQISFSKQFRIKLHLIICGACKCYKKQLDLISKLAKKIGDEDFSTGESPAMSSSTKEKIKQTLKNNS